VRDGFSGFSEEGLEFLEELKRNNRREWFQPRKQEYESLVRQPMERLVEELNARLARCAPRYITEPKKAVYRIYRDTRFSKDKTPYKTNVAASFGHAGVGKQPAAGFYCALGTEGVEVGGGIYMPGSDAVRVLRAHIGEHYERLQAILRNTKLRRLMGGLEGEQLSRNPKGFVPDHPAGDLLRYKQWISYHTRIERRIATSPKIVKQLGDCFEVMVPFVSFLNEALVDGRKKDPLLVR